MSRNSPLPAIVALAGLSFIWGYNWVVVKEALRFSGPFTFAALRSLLGGLFLFSLLPLLRRPLGPGSFAGAFLLGLLQTACFLGLSTWALVSGGAGKVAILVYTMPFWLLMLAWPLLGERLKGAQWAAVALAFSGLLLIVQPWRLHARIFSLFLAIVAGLFWAVSGVWVKRLRARVRTDLLSLTAWQLILGSIPLLIVAGWQEQRQIDWAPYFIGALVYNVIPGTALGYALWFYALQELPAGVAGMGTLLTPLVGVIAGWVQLSEVPDLWEGSGMFLILAGLGMLSLVQNQIRGAGSSLKRRSKT